MLPFDIWPSVQAAAQKYNLPPSHVAAVTEVESDGKIFATVGGVRRPLILFEPHVFYRLLSGDKLTTAVQAGIASEKWNKSLYAKSQAGRWAQVNAAAEIDPVAAFEATSFGVGQVMGQNWKDLGFSSVKEMVDYIHLGVEQQIDVMLRFIVKNGLDDELRDGRWAAFARGYNGPAYAKNQYDTKMAAAAARYGGKVAEPDGMLRLGAKGARVRELQALLVRAGFPSKVDGDFGAATQKALKAFQKSRKIKADGVYGPQTERELSEFRQGEKDKPGAEKTVDIDGVKEGAGGLGGGILVETLQNKVDEATGQLQGVSGFEPWLGYGLAALSVVAFCLAAWGVYRAVSGWIKSRQTVET